MKFQHFYRFCALSASHLRLKKRRALFYNNKKVVDALKKVGIEKLKDKLVSELSGGEKQRVAIARVLCQETKVILADEPTGALDETNSENIMTIFKNLNKEGITIIIVTHDETIAKSCNRIINIIDGHIIN